MIRYFRGRSWEEVDGLPENASLLVHCVSTEGVNDVEHSIIKYLSETGKDVPYIMAAERKDDVKFYVPRNEVENLIKFLRAKHW